PPGEARRLGPRHAGVAAEVGHPLAAEEVLVRQRLARHLGRLPGGQAKHAVHEDVRLAPRLWGAGPVVDAGPALDDRRGPEGVYRDVVTLHFLGQAHGQQSHAQLAEAAGQPAWQDRQVERRAQVDDVPPRGWRIMADHVPGDEQPWTRRTSAGK